VVSRHRWIASNVGSAGATSLGRLCASTGFAPTIAFRSNNYDVVRELVATGSGVAVVRHSGHRADHRVAAVPLQQEGAHRTLLSARRRGNTNPLLDEFLAWIRLGAAPPFVTNLPDATAQRP
jgi:DNA-binding transcriptional LysR family regulator